MPCAIAAFAGILMGFEAVQIRALSFSKQKMFDRMASGEGIALMRLIVRE